MKNHLSKISLFVLAVLLSAYILPAMTLAASYPTFTPNTDIVRVAPYNVDAHAGGQNWGTYTSGTSYSEYLSKDQYYRIRQSGTISRIKIYTATKLNLTGFYLKIWRQTSANYDLVGVSENLVSNLVWGGFSTIDLSSPITGVQEGDFYGYRIETSGLANNFSAIGATTGTRVLVNTTPDAINYNWDGSAAISGSILPIEIYMRAPVAAFIGDSIIAGHPGNFDFLETNTTTNLPSTIEYQFGGLTGYNYQNMGIGGQTTTGIAARFLNDVINLHPKLVVIEGGENDLEAVGAKSNFIANWTNMLDAAQSSDSVNTVVVLKILPWSGGTNAQMQMRDDWNTALANLASGYSKALVVDASSYVGQFRSGGTAGNLWDIKPEYNADGVHFNQAGYGQIAQSLADAIDADGLTISNVSSNLSSNSATVTWTTTRPASSKVDYGDAVSGYILSTPEADTAPRVINHSVVLSDLKACKTYQYRVRSKDAATNEAISGDYVFTTTGCSTSSNQKIFNMSSLLGGFSQPKIK